MHWDFTQALDLFLHTLGYWWVIIPSVLVGILVGAIPGLNAANTIIMLLPLTLAMKPEVSLFFMVSLYCATHLGGGIPAILINVPGTGGAAASTLDGYPMALKGLGQQALAMSFVAATAGGLIASLATLFLLPFLSRIGYYVHSVEMVVIMLFGIILIAAIAAKNMLKGLIAGVFGLLLGGIGADAIYSAPRATFGFLELYSGLPLVPVMIGLFAISEALLMIEHEIVSSKTGAHDKNAVWAQTREGIQMAGQRWWHIVWTSFIGLVIGIIPGAGASIASFVAYQQSRMYSKTPELYGTGHPEGLIAPEAANNGVGPGSLVPLMAIGVPGGETSAVMLIVLQYQGIVLGPRLFMTTPYLAYGVFIAMVLAYLFMLLTILPMAHHLSRITVVSTKYLVPIIIAFTLVGAFAPREYGFDMVIALVFGILGYLCRKTGYHVAALLIGVVLGPYIERNLMRALRISDGKVGILFSSTLGNMLWAMLVFTLLLPWLRQQWHRMAAAKHAA
ncbi:MAG TPA: tripartite tricarboxylate transporter permease [Rhodocyclaceae bacterium]|nr:tripartite tricarboxylate transporter permease [Rhodocyclaceae bacterium]